MTPHAIAPEVEEAIRHQLQACSEAALAQDWTGYVQIFDAEPMCMPAGVPAMTTPDAILEFYTHFPPLDSLEFTSDSFEAAGDLVIETGRYEFESGDLKDHGKYIHIWRRQADGTWKLYRNIANSDG